MLQKRLIIASLIIALVCGCVFIGHPLKCAQAATVTNHWTWTFSEDHLTYEVYEYSDCHFTVLENNDGHYYSITGHAYLTWNGDPRASADQPTRQYWSNIIQKYHDENLNDALLSIFELALSLPSLVVATIKNFIGSIVGVGIGQVTGAARTYGLATDRTKVFYEIFVCGKAACDLASTPGIVIPTESIPPVSE